MPEVRQQQPVHGDASPEPVTMCAVGRLRRTPPAPDRCELGDFRAGLVKAVFACTFAKHFSPVTGCPAVTEGLDKTGPTRTMADREQPTCTYETPAHQDAGCLSFSWCAATVSSWW